MPEIIKQLLLQLKQIWEKLNGTQKTVPLATMVVVMAGLITIISWDPVDGEGGRGGYSTLFLNLDPEDAATAHCPPSDGSAPGTPSSCSTGHG